MLPVSYLSNLQTLIAPSHLLGIISVPINYNVAFDLNPLSLISGWGSIIHATATNSDSGVMGARVPGIWFYPSSTGLCVSLESASTQDYTLQAPSMALNVYSHVEVNIIGLYVVTTISGGASSVQNMTVKAGRPVWNNVYIYSGDPW